MSDECISPLRRRMIEDMTVRKFTLKTRTTTSGSSRNSRFSSADRLTQLPMRGQDHRPFERVSLCRQRLADSVSMIGQEICFPGLHAR